MKIKQNDTVYQTDTHDVKYTSPVLVEKINGERKYTPLVSDEAVEEGGFEFSYDDNTYPKLAAKFNNNTYHVANKRKYVYVPTQAVNRSPSITPLMVIYANDDDLTITSSNNRKAWQSIRTTAQAYWDNSCILEPANPPSEEWVSDENYLNKIPILNTDKNVLRFSASKRIGFSFTDGNVLPNNSTDVLRSITSTVIHISSYTDNTIVLISGIWLGLPSQSLGECEFAVKIDIKNNKVYYGGDIAHYPGGYKGTIDWTEVPLTFNFIKDANGWYDINVPLSIVLDSIQYENKMFSLLLYPDDTENSNPINKNELVLDNFYLYTDYRSVVECREVLRVEIEEIDKYLADSDYSFCYDSLLELKTEAMSVYDNSTSQVEIAEEISKIANALSYNKDVKDYREALANTIAEATEMADSGKYSEESTAQLRAQITSAQSVLVNYPTDKDQLYTANVVLKTMMEGMIDAVDPKFTLVASTKDAVETIAFSSANYASASAYSAVATASSEVQQAAYAIDNNSGTRWETASSDPQWLKIDLGSVKTFDEIGIRWEAAHVKKIAIRYSNDNTTWESLGYREHTEGLAEISYRYVLDEAITARYVQIFCHTRCSQYGNSIWSMYVANTTSDCYYSLFYDFSITPSFNSSSGRLEAMETKAYNNANFNLYATLGDSTTAIVEGDTLMSSGCGFVKIAKTAGEETSGTFTTLPTYIPVNYNYVYLNLNNITTKTKDSSTERYTWGSPSFIWRGLMESGKKYFFKLKDLAFSGFVSGQPASVQGGFYVAVSPVDSAKAGTSTTITLYRNGATKYSSVSITPSATETKYIGTGPARFDTDYTYHATAAFADETIATDFNSVPSFSTIGNDLIVGYGVTLENTIDI